MRVALLTFAIVCAYITALTVAVRAQRGTTVLLVNLPATARVSFSATSVTFPDADPTATPFVPSVPVGVTISARARVPRNSQITLTLQSTDDLRSGVTVLPASLITWTASGAGFAGGTLSRTTPQLVGRWTGSGVRTGTQNFRFENRWTHPTGIYSATLVYTLSSP
ncbi:MAG TPA: hypothetical protein VH740_09195 [Vicinamibacterales bacterium]|jgi:hypothetical protein